MAVRLVSALIPGKTGRKWKSVPIRDALPKICQPTLHLNGDLLSWQLDEQAAKLWNKPTYSTTAGAGDFLAKAKRNTPSAAPMAMPNPPSIICEAIVPPNGALMAPKI